MSPAIVDATARRIAEHAARHRLEWIELILHGGEPLLAGPSTLAAVATAVRERLSSNVRLSVQVQTNGVLLNDGMLETFLSHHIRVGVSLDGAREDHDRHRGHANGRGSYDQVADALRLLNTGRYRDLYSGILCVIDIDADPLTTYRSLLAFDPPAINFLLPHGNWSTPPPGRTSGSVSTPYGDWLVTVFDYWYGAPRRATEIRLFAEIINLALDGPSWTESVGLSPVALVAVNTDGSMEQVDTLRSSYDGAAGTGLNVMEHSFDDVLSHPAIVARQVGLAALSDTCAECRLRLVCGGGCYPHRYREGGGYRNPSVYCPDLTRLIDHIATRLRDDVGALTS